MALSCDVPLPVELFVHGYYEVADDFVEGGAQRTVFQSVAGPPGVDVDGSSDDRLARRAAYLDGHYGRNPEGGVTVSY